jgi:hypothetical protein
MAPVCARDVAVVVAGETNGLLNSESIAAACVVLTAGMISSRRIDVHA